MRFLADAQRLKVRPVHDVSEYERSIWFNQLPEHRAVRTPFPAGSIDPAESVIVVDRVPAVAPPELPESLLGKTTPLNDAQAEPTLRDLTAQDDEALPDNPELLDALDQYLHKWRSWAGRERADKPVRDLYLDLFDIWTRFEASPDTLQLVIGVGCLVWQLDKSVRRHLFTSSASIDFDSDSGRITVSSTPVNELLELELGMLDQTTAEPAAPHLIPRVRDELVELDTHPLDRETARLLCTQVANVLDPEAVFVDVDGAPRATQSAQIAFAPALILRKRPDRFVEIYEQIADQIREAGEVPDGLLPLVNPDHVADPLLTWADGEGALEVIDDEPFLPLPVNEQQLKIIRSVDSSAHTLVQGPPGTGKTHTAAALISNLLARGKRVLITAQTDRALTEVRDKLPESIKQLAVSVLGSARGDMSELQQAVQTIGGRAAEFSVEHSDAEITRLRDSIDRLRRARADANSALVAARESEVIELEIGSLRGTPARLAQAFANGESEHGWILPLIEDVDLTKLELDKSRILECLALITDAELRADADDAYSDLIDLDDVTSPEEFDQLVADLSSASASAVAGPRATRHRLLPALEELDDVTREALASRTAFLADERAALGKRREQWIPEALDDAFAARLVTWNARFSEIEKLLHQVRTISETIPTGAHVSASGDRARMKTAIAALEAYLARGDSFKTTGGRLGVKLLADKQTKEAAGLVSDSLRVNGALPSTKEELAVAAAWLRADDALDALDRSWPATLEIPQEDTISERLHFHVEEAAVLERVLNFAKALDVVRQDLAGLGARGDELTEPKDLGRLADAITLAALRAREQAAREPVAELAEYLSAPAAWENAAPCLRELHASVEALDGPAYRRAYDRIVHLLVQSERLARKDELVARLAAALPRVLDAWSDQPEVWGTRTAALPDALEWAYLGDWLSRREQLDVNELQQRITEIETEIREVVGELAAARAWAYAVGPERITGTARADLQNYAQQVQKLGKGTGKHAARRRTEIRTAMDRCRPSVPVWIMPIYRVVEQQRIEPNAFDVVIVDEASQAGAEATFLQHLAPKIVVIGDHKQVSPTAVGQDRDQFVRLADQYLYDDPYRNSWQEPESSLFDLARMRYPGMITLTEHRRCVPEIIGFSNRIAYEPENIRLIPVRQVGAERLEPIVTVRVTDGYETGNGNSRFNPPEVEAVVAQIEKCLADPRYDNLTLGVISLLGGSHSKMIRNRLLERIRPEEWEARELRCGDPADFQGSERDVMFLSMVAAPRSEGRIGAATRELNVQRYNVAFSRAKDQVFLFHSIGLEDVPNPEDVRNALLDYCSDIESRRRLDESLVSYPVSETERDHRFDSLFEQRVYNRLVDHGCTVVPQYPQMGYKMDLVVIGPYGQFAIECDGDEWHGPDQFYADLARERELQRCGWEIVRVRESDFYADPARALSPIWAKVEATKQAPERTERVATSTRHVVALEVEDDDADLDDYADEGELTSSTDAQAAAPVEEFASDWKPATTSVDVRTEPASTPVVEISAAEPPVAPARYETFKGVAQDAMVASESAAADVLVHIAEIEGPVVGERLLQAYVRASGGQRVGSQIAKALNLAVSRAVRDGRLIEDRPLNEQGVKFTTYRTPGQPFVRVRELGPRLIDQVPPRELAAVVGKVLDEVGDRSEERLVRGVLEFFGQKRLTANARERVARLMPLVR